MKKYYLKIINSLLVFVLTGFLMPTMAGAVFNASDVLGQFNSDGTKSFTDTAPYSANISPSVFSSPGTTLFDPVKDRLYVVDGDRIMIFNLVNGELLDKNADYVLGRNSLTAEGIENPINAAQFYGGLIEGLALSTDGNTLFVSDSDACRVMVFDVNTIVNGEDAVHVLGASDLQTVATCDMSDTELSYTRGLAYISGMLYVANGPRVVVFDLTGGISDGMTASYVIGQPDFVTSNAAWPAADSFSDAYGLFYDVGYDRLYVGDSGRVMVFDDITTTVANGLSASYVLGKPDFTTPPGGIPTAQNLYDNGTNGIGGFDLGAAELLFVSDLTRILVFDVTSITNGESAQYVLGQSLFTTIDAPQGGSASASEFALSRSFGVDTQLGKLYVPDSNAGRVMIFDVNSISNGEDAVDLLGQYNSLGGIEFAWNQANGADVSRGFGSNGNGGVVVDQVDHRLFVADNDRILVFNLDQNNVLVDKQADSVLGAETLYSQGVGSVTRDSLGGINGIGYSSKRKRLYVSQDAHRISVFDLSGGITNGMDAAYVIGASDFTTLGGGASASRFYSYGMYLDDARDRLYIIDRNNLRGVLVFDVSGSLSNGMSASYILGQSNFTDWDGVGFPSASSTGNVLSLTSDPARDLLFVGEEGRILVYNLSGGITNGMEASYVLGVSDFTTVGGGVSQTQVSEVLGLTYDENNRLLYVSQRSISGGGAYRISIFDLETITNGEPAVSVIGRADFTTSGYVGASQSTFEGNSAVFLSTSTRNLYVQDAAVRVLLFSLIDFATDTTPQATVGTAFSHTLTATSSQGTVTYELVSGTLPDGLSLNTTTGLISGTPTTATTSTFSVKITDTLSVAQVFYHTQEFTLTVAPAPVTTAAPPSNGPIVVSSGGGGGGFAMPGTVKNYIVPNQPEVKQATTSTTTSVRNPTPITIPQTNTPLPTTYPRNLGIGSRGEDVRNLQKLLNSLGFIIASSGPGSPGNETTYYGTLTSNAVKRLQEANRERILSPFGLTSGTGYFGPATKKYLEGIRF